jgi:outer membrane protein assembly factor BamB
MVIVTPGGTAKEGTIAFDKGVAAYDAKSGQLVWAAGKRQASYGSPRVEEIGGIRQLLIPNADGLSGHSLDGGKELWFFPLSNPPKVNSSMPWKLDDGSLLFGTGYGIGSVRLDITSVDGIEWTAKQRWQTNRFRPKFNDFFVRDGHAYGLDDGTLACLDVENGKVKWKSGRYGYGQLLLIDDIMLIITEDGDLLLVPATPTKPEAIATFKVFDSGFCWNHPVLVRGKLLVRNAVEAVCLDVSEAPNGE